MEEPPANSVPSESNHCRDIARKLRELARQFRFPGVRQELLDLALRYECRAENLDARASTNPDVDHR